MGTIPDVVVHVHVHFDDPEAHARIRELEADLDETKRILDAHDLDPAFPQSPQPLQGA